jgi:hypothetical protein
VPPLPDQVDVPIVGAGISGIGVAAHLTVQQPGRTFAVLETRDAIGETRDLFQNPGSRSDWDLNTFGYEFKPWTSANADGDEILSIQPGSRADPLLRLIAKCCWAVDDNAYHPAGREARGSAGAGRPDSGRFDTDRARARDRLAWRTCSAAQRRLMFRRYC